MATEMAKPYSNDFRQKVITAIERDGRKSSQLGETSCGPREEQDSCYGDRAISSTAFHAGVAFTTGLSLPHDLTDQCLTHWILTLN
jgi:hypothetical protein